MPIIRRTVRVTRKNGGIIKLDVPIHGITAMKVNSIIYEGKDFSKDDVPIMRLLINRFVRGLEIGTPMSSQEYTAIFSTDDCGEWNGSDNDWDWTTEDDEETPGEKKNITDIEINSSINYSKARDIKLTIELTFKIE